jgi:type IX secretion system PorP/SprF family membrane protein
MKILLHRKYIETVVFFTIWILSQNVLAQQRPVYSQYMFNGLVINPAYAGSQKQLVATGVYRKQWVNLDGAPSIQVLSVHSGFEKRKIGIGFTLSNDQVGVHNDLSFYGSYAYQIKMRKGTLAMGLQAGFNNLKSDFTKVNAKNGNDPLLNIAYSKLNPNFGTGLYYSTSTAYLGVSIPFLLTNKVFKETEIITEARESRYYFITGGKVFDLDRKLKIKPSFLLRLQEGAPVGMDINTNLIIDDVVTVGASYRSNDAMVFLFNFQANENFGFGYAYDWTLSALNRYTKGSHEILVSYRINLTNKPCHTYF